MTYNTTSTKTIMAEAAEKPDESSSFIYDLFTSPLNLALIGLCGYLLFKIIMGRKTEQVRDVPPREPELPKLKKKDMTVEDVRNFDGHSGDGRILVAVNGKVFDVTRGKRFYGPGGPYGLFGGRDASRALATFSVSEDAIKDEYDDLSDLTSMQMDSIREWEMQFTEKYDYVGRLLKPGEKAQDYSETEDEHDHSNDTSHSSTSPKKDQ